MYEILYSNLLSLSIWWWYFRLNNDHQYVIWQKLWAIQRWKFQHLMHRCDIKCWCSSTSPSSNETLLYSDESSSLSKFLLFPGLLIRNSFMMCILWCKVDKGYIEIYKDGISSLIFSSDRKCIWRVLGPYQCFVLNIYEIILINRLEIECWYYMNRCKRRCHPNWLSFDSKSIMF